jgi:uncharacterized repeat protein (TIGR01451 family)
MSCLRRGGARSGRERIVRLTSLCAALFALGSIWATAASGAAPGPHWSIVSQSEPTDFAAGDTNDAYRIVIRNNGASPTAPTSTVTVADTLPAGVTATKIATRGEGPNGSGSPRYEMTCPAPPVTQTITCTYQEPAPVLAGAVIVLTITVSLDGATALASNSATVSGGGAPSATVSEPAPLGGDPAPFGLSYFNAEATAEDGEADTQAGSHPFELTTSLAFNIASREPGGGEAPLPNAAPKDVEVELPPGLVGDPSAMPRCAQQEFQAQEGLNCPLDTQVGTVKPFFYGSFPSAVYPLFNVVPPPGEPVELGFSVANIGHIPIFFHLRSNGNYGLTAQIKDIPEVGPLQGAILTLWGVPADASHDLEREGTTGQGRQQEEEFCQPFVDGATDVETRCPSGVAAKPFLTLPSTCPGTELPVSARADSWQEPEPQPSLQEPELDDFLPENSLPALTGCEHLAFDPSLTVQPEMTQAGEPSGYTFDVHVPQNEDPTGLATPDLRSVSVTLPPGVVLSPSSGNGLQACSDEQFGLHELPPASCPSGSSIGSVQILTPALSSPLEGQLFLGKPACEPCDANDAQEGRLVSLFAQAQGSGVIVKLQGSVAVDQSTGRLTATFAEDPQWPLEDVKLTLKGGPGAALANPSTCGAPLTAISQLIPYSSETPLDRSSQPFDVGGCVSPRFSPSFIAGTTSNQAGAFSPAVVTVSRIDQDADLQSIAVRMPPGLLGMLSKIPLCAEAQAQAGTCGPRSQIGRVTVGAGPGSDPLFLEGRVYLSGPHDGAPFGLSIVVPVAVGPLDLGTIAVRAAIDVDPSTAALSIVSEPLPQSLDGIPLQIRTVDLDLEREGFIFNPTDCRTLAIEGTLSSAQGSSATVSTPFQAADCATLPFKPKLTALTHARAGRAAGVYLHVKVASGPGQANIAKLKVDLPKQLSARMTALQKACPVAVVQADPASCPAASVVGTATAVTPVLENPLVGPAYLVSHGGAALPALEIVLQGEGVTIELIGQTTIAHGVVSSAFKSLPDAPISTLDLVLAAGARSLLAPNLPAKAGGSMCRQSLAMPVAITGQNGAVVKHTAHIAVSGCAKRRA